MHMMLFFYFELYLTTCSKKNYSFIRYYKKEKEVYLKYFLFKVFCRFSQTACPKNVLMVTKVSYCFALSKANILGKVYIKANARLLDPFFNRNDTVCGYVNRKNNIEDFQRSEVTFPVEILAQLNELQEGDGIIQK